MFSMLSIIYGISKLTYLNLSTSTSTCETIWVSLWN